MQKTRAGRPPTRRRRVESARLPAICRGSVRPQTHQTRRSGDNLRGTRGSKLPSCLPAVLIAVGLGQAEEAGQPHRHTAPLTYWWRRRLPNPRGGPAAATAIPRSPHYSEHPPQPFVSSKSLRNRFPSHLLVSEMSSIPFMRPTLLQGLADCKVVSSS